jgi:putative serine protease PepD
VNRRFGSRLTGKALVPALLLACTGCTATTDDSGQSTASEGTTSSAASSPSPTASSSAPSGRQQARRQQAGRSVDWSQVASDVEPSVVSIAVRGQAGAGEGSGVIIDDNGHVLTNNHVVAAATSGGEMQVALSDARVFDADLVGADPATDLAVIQIDSAPDDLEALPFGDSEAVRVGQPVMAVGNPLGLSHTVTLGIVSALDRPVTTQNEGGSPADQGVPVVTNAIQTDAAVNPGNSGGALVDADGRLIGVNSSIATLGASGDGQGGSIGLGFAIPAGQAQWVSQALIGAGSVRHAYLGVSPVDAVVDINGVRRGVAGLSDVIEDTPAARAGLREGEAVTAVDGETVASAESLVAQIRERKPGTKVVLSVANRSGEARDVAVEFGTRPDS